MTWDIELPIALQALYAAHPYLKTVRGWIPADGVPADRIFARTKAECDKAGIHIVACMISRLGFKTRQTSGPRPLQTDRGVYNVWSYL